MQFTYGDGAGVLFFDAATLAAIALSRLSSTFTFAGCGRTSWIMATTSSPHSGSAIKAICKDFTPSGIAAVSRNGMQNRPRGVLGTAQWGSLASGCRDRFRRRAAEALADGEE